MSLFSKNLQGFQNLVGLFVIQPPRYIKSHRKHKKLLFVKNLESTPFISMKPFLVKYPSILRKLYPHRITRLEAPKSLYLTFDDGPIPAITPWVLRLLHDYNAKATFFCIGDNIKKNPDAFQQIIQQGHRIGNHTFNHLNGWKTSEENYVKNTVLAEQEIEKFKKEEIKFFRPPYGKITNSQAKKLVQLNYKIVMWDVLSGDFDQTISAEKCYNHVIKNTKAGSTIVFHDSIKASKNLKNVLPKVLKYYAEKGYRFEAL